MTRDEYLDKILTDYSNGELSAECYAAALLNIDNMTKVSSEINECELAYQIEDRIIVIQECEDGYDYTIMDDNYREIDGGVYDNPDIDIHTALMDIVEDIKDNPDTNGVKGKITKDSKLIPMDYEDTVSKAEDRNRIVATDVYIKDYDKQYFLKYREITDKYFVNLGGMDQYEICDMVKEYIENYTQMYEIDVDFEDIALYGSRSRGLEKDDSDIDIVVQYSGNYKEDYIFSILAEEKLEIEGKKIDINPIKTDISLYLIQAEEYLSHKKEMLKENEFKNLAADIDEFGYDFCVYNYLDELVGDRDSSVDKIYKELKEGSVKSLIEGIESFIEDSEDKSWVDRGNALIERIKGLPGNNVKQIDDKPQKHKSL